MIGIRCYRGLSQKHCCAAVGATDSNHNRYRFTACIVSSLMCVCVSSAKFAEFTCDAMSYSTVDGALIEKVAVFAEVWPKMRLFCCAWHCWNWFYCFESTEDPSIFSCCWIFLCAFVCGRTGFWPLLLPLLSVNKFQSPCDRRYFFLIVFWVTSRSCSTNKACSSNSQNFQHLLLSHL